MHYFNTKMIEDFDRFIDNFLIVWNDKIVKKIQEAALWFNTCSILQSKMRIFSTKLEINVMNQNFENTERSNIADCLFFVNSIIYGRSRWAFLVVLLRFLIDSCFQLLRYDKRRLCPWLIWLDCVSTSWRCTTIWLIQWDC